jgi:plastocyanin
MVRRRAFVLLAASLLALSACGSESHDTTTAATEVPNGSDGPATTQAGAADASTTTASLPEGTVAIVDFEFSPRQLTVTRGETVTWVNQDPYDHWIVSTQPDVLDSGQMSQAQTYSKTFSQAGDYTYYCNIHNYMKASVTVR